MESQEVEKGGDRDDDYAQRIDIEDAAIGGTGLARNLLGRIGRDGALAEDHADIMHTHRVDYGAHLLRRALAVGIDRPEVELLQPEVAGEVGKGALARHQPPPIFGKGFEPVTDGLDRRLQLLRICACIGDIDLGLGRRSEEPTSELPSLMSTSYAV